MPADVGIYGKLPAHPDFVRWNAGAFSSAGLDVWLEEAMGAVVQRGAPVQPCSFLLSPAGARDAFVGSVHPSADAVGRTFPVAVFQRFSAQDMTASFPSVAAAAQPFLEAVHQLLQTQATSAEVLVGAVSRVPAIPQGGGALAEICSRPAAAATAATAYAFRTVIAAADAVGRSARAPRTQVMLEAPLASSEAPAFWLELLRRRLRWPDGAPSALWSHDRMLVALGAPPPSLLAELALPRQHAKLWPLTTPRSEAEAEAEATLTPAQRAVLQDPRASLGDLLKAFGEPS